MTNQQLEKFVTNDMLQGEWGQVYQLQGFAHCLDIGWLAIPPNPAPLCWVLALLLVPLGLLWIPAPVSHPLAADQQRAGAGLHPRASLGNEHGGRDVASSLEDPGGGDGSDGEEDFITRFETTSHEEAVRYRNQLFSTIINAALAPPQLRIDRWDRPNRRLFYCHALFYHLSRGILGFPHGIAISFRMSATNLVKGSVLPVVEALEGRWPRK